MNQIIIPSNRIISKIVTERVVSQKDNSATYNARYTFSAKEKDSETGYSYFGARYYESGLSIWLSVDPLSDKYPSLSPYVYCANNPVILVDPDGRKIDPSLLTENEKANYFKKIDRLSENKMFATFYSALENSEKNYTIVYGEPPGGGGGAFDSGNNTVYILNTENNYNVIINELFHAYQYDLEVYTNADQSVIEAEADIITGSIMMNLVLYGMLPISLSEHDELFDKESNWYFKIDVFDNKFDIEFNRIVDDRIKKYNERSKSNGTDAPKAYIQKNSGVGAKAIKQLIKEMNKN